MIYICPTRFKILKYNSQPIISKLLTAFPVNDFSSFQPISSQCYTYGKTRSMVFTSKMCEKHLRKSDILIKDAGQQPAFSIIRTLVGNRLITMCFMLDEKGFLDLPLHTIH